MLGESLQTLFRAQLVEAFEPLTRGLAPAKRVIPAASHSFGLGDVVPLVELPQGLGHLWGDLRKIQVVKDDVVALVPELTILSKVCCQPRSLNSKQSLN